MNRVHASIGDYEERIALLTNEVRRLNLVIDEKTSEGYRNQTELT